MKAFDDLSEGFLIPFRAIPMIAKDKKLLKWSAFPTLINIILYVYLMATTWGWLYRRVDAAASSMSDSVASNGV